MLGGQVKKEAKYMGNTGECWLGPSPAERTGCRWRLKQWTRSPRESISQGKTKVKFRTLGTSHIEAGSRGRISRQIEGKLGTFCVGGIKERWRPQPPIL